MEQMSETKKLEELLAGGELTKAQEGYLQALIKFNALVEKRVVEKRQNQLLVDVTKISYNV